MHNAQWAAQNAVNTYIDASETISRLRTNSSLRLMMRGMSIS